MSIAVWTIGHSTHPIGEFVRLLRDNRIATLADVRRFPASRWPQFKQEPLRATLAGQVIEYVHLAELGGYRKGGYEEHVKTSEFAIGLLKLMDLARDRRTAIMCAEAVFFRCHRRFIAEALVKAGHEVVHIFPDGRTQSHRPLGSLESHS